MKLLALLILATFVAGLFVATRERTGETAARVATQAGIPSPAAPPSPLKPSAVPHPTHASRTRHVEPHGPFWKWVASSHARRVANCESGGSATVIGHHRGVTYFGKWQANEDFVRTYAGVDPWHYVEDGRFTLPEHEQDRMAYAGWLARGWQPWSCR